MPEKFEPGHKSYTPWALETREQVLSAWQRTKDQKSLARLAGELGIAASTVRGWVKSGVLFSASIPSIAGPQGTPHILAADETAERPLPTSPLEPAFFFLALSQTQRDRFIDELPRYRIAKQRGTSIHLFPVEVAGLEGADINDRLLKIRVSLSTLSDVDEVKYFTATGLMREVVDRIDPVWSEYNDTKNQLREAREESTQRDASTIELLERQLTDFSAQMADVNPFQLVDPEFHALVLDLEYYLRTLIPEDHKDEILAYLYKR